MVESPGLNEVIRRLAQGLVRELVDALARKWGRGFLGCALFGSVARGSQGRVCDLDLLVILEDGAKPGLNVFKGFWREDASPGYRKLDSQGLRMDPSPVVWTRARLATHPWLLLDIVEHGVVLHDPEGLLASTFEDVRRGLKSMGSRKVLLPDGSWFWHLKPDWKPGEVVRL